MSKIFYDHLISLRKTEKTIKEISTSYEEREELIGIVDGIVVRRVIETTLAKLPIQDHGDFLEMFEKAPHDTGILDYLTKKIKEDMEELIRKTARALDHEIVSLIR